MARITSILVVVLAITATSSSVLAIDCLSYLAADTALKKANNDVYAAYQKAVQAAEAAWEEAVQHRDAAWREAGKAASEALSNADAVYQLPLDSASRDLRKAKVDANAIRASAVDKARSALSETLDKARTDILGRAQTLTFRNAWDTYRKAHIAALTNASAGTKFFDILRELLEARLALGDALAKVAAEARAPYKETWIAAEVKHKKALIAAAQVQRESHAKATAAHQKAKAQADTHTAATLDAAHLKAGKDAYAVYWQTIHGAYFTYRNTLEPADADRLVAEAKAKDKWRETYIDIYKNPNIGLVRTVSGQSEEQILELAEAERQKCPY